VFFFATCKKDNCKEYQSNRSSLHVLINLEFFFPCWPIDIRVMNLELQHSQDIIFEGGLMMLNIMFKKYSFTYTLKG
jgi:hypothetical protein